MAVRLVLADDHPIILDGLENLFRLEKDFKVVARCRDGDETLRAVRQHRPDILVLDIRMPGKDGLAVLREMKKEKLTARVVLLTAALDDDDVLEAIRLGVRGVVLKEMAPQLLVQCIRKVYEGGEWLEKRSIIQLLDKMLRQEVEARERRGSALTARELEVIRMVARGMRNREIASSLSISEGTVKIHLHNIYEKLDLEGRIQLTIYAREHGLA